MAASGYRKTSYESVYWRGDALYAVVRAASLDASGRRRRRWVRVGSKQQRTTPAEAAQAQRELQRREDRLWRGEDDPRALAAMAGERRPIADVIAEYAEHLKARRRTAKHIKQTRAWLERWTAPAPEGCAVETLRDADALRLTRWLGEQRDAGWSASTANAVRAAVLGLTRYAADHGLTLANPIPSGLVLKANEQADPVRPPRAMPLEDLDRLIAAAPNKRAAMYALGGYAGVRWEEMARLRWHNIDHTGPDALLIIDASQAKNGRTAELPLLAPALEALGRWREEMRRTMGRPGGGRGGVGGVGSARGGRRVEGVGPADGDLIFGSIAGHREWMRDLRAARLIGRPDPKRPGGPWIGSDGYENARGERLERKCLRTTFGSALAARGVSLQVAQRLMRHSDPKLTMRHYTRIGLNPMREGAERLLAASDEPAGATALQPLAADSSVRGVKAGERPASRAVS